MRHLVLILAIGLFAQPVVAQQIYKCANGKGGNTYQQTACATAAQDKGVRQFRREPDAPHTNVRQQRDYDAAPTRNQPSQSQAHPSGAYAIGYDSGEARRRLDNMGSTQEGRAQLRAMRQRNSMPAIDAGQPSSNAGIGAPVRAVDIKTGEQHEFIKVAPFQVWNPRTGRYHTTDGNGNIIN